MTTIIFTDTHFGTKQNSITWFNSQKEFILMQLLPAIKSFDNVRLIHLGDVFDSRSTISTYIATGVVELFEKLSESVQEFIIIGGNHDYYSPNTDRIDTLNLLFRDFDIRLITDHYEIDLDDIKSDDKNLYIPWYEWLNHEKDILDIINQNNIKNIFTHADIVINPPKNIPSDVKVFSGHMHTPLIKDNLYNLGSCYSLDFSDSNADRGFYIIHENGTFERVINTQSIKFWRLYDEDIFKDAQYRSNDYFEIYISQSNLQDQTYVNRLSEYIKKYKNSVIIPRYTQIEQSDIDSIDLKHCNIEDMIKDLIPEELSKKFGKVLEKYQEQSKQD